MTPLAWLAAGCAALAAALLAGRGALEEVPPAARAASVADDRGADGGWLRRYRLLLCGCCAAGGAVLVGGPLAPAAGVLAAVVCWVVVARAEPASVRERREEISRSLPHVVALVAAALRGGAAPGPALGLVADALPGPATDAARVVAGRLSLGADAAEAWSWLAREPGLAPWGRAMTRAHETGAPVVETVERLADELAAQARAEVEDRARTVGVRAAVPLGLCLLPAFLLVGIVPLVAGLLGSLW